MKLLLNRAVRVTGICYFNCLRKRDGEDDVIAADAGDVGCVHSVIRRFGLSQM